MKQPTWWEIAGLAIGILSCIAAWLAVISPGRATSGVSLESASSTSASAQAPLFTTIVADDATTAAPITSAPATASPQFVPPPQQQQPRPQLGRHKQPQLPDFDSDGVPDGVDRCPRAPETVNGFQDDDGCPDKPPAPSSKEATCAALVAEGEATRKVRDAMGCPSTPY